MSSTSTEVKMPSYKCTKVVSALKIKDIVPGGIGFSDLIFEEGGYAPTQKSNEWVEKRGALPGGYYVVYKDGYESWSPAKAFEEGYEKL